MNLLTTDYFELFALPISFDIDLAVLKTKWYALQKQYHPDQMLHQDQSLAAFVNQAYRVLSTPIDRAIYMLKRLGVDIESETNTQMPLDFLMAQMELRERLEGGEDILNEVTIQIQETEQRFKAAFTPVLNQEQAVLAVRKMLFYHQLLRQTQRIAHGSA